MFTLKQRTILLGLGFTPRDSYDRHVLTYAWENFDYHGDGGEVVLRVGAKGRRGNLIATYASGAELPKFWASKATQGEAAIRTTSFPRLMAAIAELRLKM